MKHTKLIITIVVALSMTITISTFFSACQKQTDTLPIANDQQTIIEKVFSTIDSLFNVDQESAFGFARTMLNSDSVLNNPILYYSIVTKMGVLKVYTGDSDSSSYYFNIALNYWKLDTSYIGHKNHSSLLFNIAYNYKNEGKIDTAIYLFNEAAIFSEKINLYRNSAKVNLLLSDTYQSKGDYCKALEYIEKSIHLCHINNDSALMISTLQTLADLYTNCYLFDEAKNQFDNVLNYQNHFTPYSKFCYYNGKGRMYYLNDNYANAKYEFLKALELADRNDVITYMIILSNLAETSILLDELDSAKHYLEILGEKHDGINSFPIFKYNYNSLLGEYYYRIDQSLLAQNAFAISDSIGEKIEIDKVLLKLHKKRKARFLAKTGKFANAYTEMREYNELDKSILEENSRKQVAGLKYKFQRDTTIISQRNDIVLNQRQIKTYKYRQSFFIGSIVVLFLFVGMIILFFRKMRALNYEKNMRIMVALKMESIRGHISPHFVFNVLNNIWAIIDDKETSKNHFDHLINLIRNSLINTEKLAIPLTDEIDFVKSFIDLQKLMLDNNLEVCWNIESGIDISQLVPGMILQIPVENAIKHGLAPKKDDRILAIEIIEGTGFLQFTITDNGAGIQQSPSPTKGTGTGLKVLTNTIHILNQMNEDKILYETYNLNIEGKQGTKVTVKIPLHYNYNLN
jgi:tetratricopeptide (TPR) repeat protein